MAQELHMDPIKMELIKLIEQKDVAINQLKSRIDGVGTKLQFLLERLNSSAVESRLQSVNDNYDAYEIKLDKLVRRIDILENNMNQNFKS